MQKCILSVDTGADDTALIVHVLKHPDIFDVRGLIAVAGNTRLDKAYRNSCHVANQVRSGIHLIAGSASPLVKTLEVAEDVHGETGMGDVKNLPEPCLTPQSFLAHEWLAEKAQSNSGPLLLLASGPLTDVAKAIQHFPDMVDHCKLIWMGGAFGFTDHLEKAVHGNMTPWAEFNAYTDPEAADQVLSSGMPVTIIPLDATHQFLCTEERLAELGKLATGSGPGVAETVYLAMKGMQRFYQEIEGICNPIHDLNVGLIVTHPHLCECTKPQTVRVVIDPDNPQYGRTIVSNDPYGKNNCTIVSRVKDALAWSAFMNTLSQPCPTRPKPQVPYTYGP